MNCPKCKSPHIENRWVYMDTHKGLVDCMFCLLCKEISYTEELNRKQEIQRKSLQRRIKTSIVNDVTIE